MNSNERCISNLWIRNSKPILGTITGRFAVRATRWTVEQALGFLAEEAYLPSEAARIAQSAVK